MESEIEVYDFPDNILENTKNQPNDLAFIEHLFRVAFKFNGA